MDRLFITSLVLLTLAISTVESSQEILNKCRFRFGDDLKCDNFQYNYLPYIESYKGAKSVEMRGNFSEIVFDPRYEHLRHVTIVSYNLQKVELEKYATFKQFQFLTFYNSEEEVELDFSGAEKLQLPLQTRIYWNKKVNLSCKGLKSSNLKQLFLQSSGLEHFDFSCVPNTMTYLSLSRNLISSLNLASNNESDPNTTDSNCSYLKSLTSLTTLDLSVNLLESFSFKCLPSSIEHINVRDNRITQLPDLSQVPHSHPVQVGIRGNPINCTCSLLQSYIQLLASGQVTYTAYTAKRVTCANVSSELAHYPWFDNIQELKSYDASALGCLISGGTDSELEDSDISNDNTTEDSSTGNEGFNNTENVSNKNDTNIDSNNDNDTDKNIDNDNSKTANVSNNTDNNNNNTVTSSKQNAIDTTTILPTITTTATTTTTTTTTTATTTTSTLRRNTTTTTTEADDNGNSGSFNLVNLSFIIISHITTLCFMLL